MSTDLIKINPVDFGLDNEKVQSIESAFMPKMLEREAIAPVYDRIIQSELSKELSKDAGEVRRKLVKVRTGIADIHKSQKAYFLAAGRYVDAWKNKETEPIEQMEATLKEIETYYERLEQERLLKLKLERESIISKYCDNVTMYNCGTLSDNDFDDLCTTLKLAKESKDLAIARAEQERIELENARIEQERLDAIERERIKAENLALQAAKDKANAEMVLFLQKQIKDKEEAEERARKEAEQKAAKELKAAKEAEEAARRAPDKIKLLDLASFFEAIVIPEFKSEAGVQVMTAIKERRDELINFMKEMSSRL